MIKGWRAGSATIIVALLTSALIILDLTDGPFRRWWSSRAFTTDAVGGILVVLITVLIVNQVLRIRQGRDRSQATAAQTDQPGIATDGLLSSGAAALHRVAATRLERDL